MENQKMFSMKLSKIYGLLCAKAQRKNRTKEEVDEIIFWLTGYNDESFNSQLLKDVDYKTFFDEAPSINPKIELIKGSICGCKIDEIQDPLMRKIRCLDKLIDELAKGKPMEKILRK